MYVAGLSWIFFIFRLFSTIQADVNERPSIVYGGKKTLWSTRRDKLWNRSINCRCSQPATSIYLLITLHRRAVWRRWRWRLYTTSTNSRYQPPHNSVNWIVNATKTTLLQKGAYICRSLRKFCNAIMRAIIKVENSAYFRILNLVGCAYD